MESNLDKRVRKTKNTVTEALLVLMKEKPINQITISELTEAAGVNRKTFYNHYDSLYDVLDELENNCCNWALSFLQDVPLDRLAKDPATFFVEIAEGLKRHEDLLALLYGAGVHSNLFEKITESIKKYILDRINREISRPLSLKMQLVVEYVVAGSGAIFEKMFTEDAIDLDEIKDFFSYLFTSTLIHERFISEVSR